MFVKKENTGFKGGLNLLDVYPLKFCSIIEEISSDGIPETFQFQVPDHQVEHIIVNLCPTEPWALPNWVILKHKTPLFLNMLREIKTRYFSEAKFSLAINEKEGRVVEDAGNFASNEDWMRVFPLYAKYPQDDPVLLTKVILGMDVHFGQDAKPLGVLILDAQTVSAIYESCILRKNVNSRFIVLSGTGLTENEIVNVQLGTPLEKIMKDKRKTTGRHRVFINGPLRGQEITDLSQKIDWSVNHIVVLEEKNRKVIFPMIKSDEFVLTTNLLGELRRCVYCNYCDDICPVDLEPALYYHSYMRGEKHKARLYNLGKCIECGLCSFICPSKLELLQIIKECKALDKQNEKIT
ncbi:MAG: 4Fe-4S dicluster domain-containing protein [Candidatus Brocadia sp. AMX2]|uniref:Na+-translocating NADH-quinone reductase subunit A n=1 Tax=Candidatus Brocadia sinica JPN1 TaxID=1197129 RepID=A0ABQ0JYY3_9BACT|nr:MULTISPECIES: 4Fe-4S dicluster domain-containing protein [Brocadia]KXK24970.1 MAG: Na+-translocating NADH-quinone reductase subunit A [Candidatus Brocadia sinica]MBC6932363.1 4Fe-4S dicluster domain-containing protein [Candidatus Brocadia sp.]MBL1169821.1 4Fe-4S dicluster domain-containing protein [Candidatus Brocadia sp. AMX1]NOG40266.1 4Fe-4S dicluster domain-containing protein [Planctomycetota bacterium]KAA0243738.1 MAG: 4Fe-4S dicluster domain-containing protein [Candidatus Brocadia sp.